MRNILGSFFKALSVIGIVAFGLWGTTIETMIVYKVAGLWGVVIGFILLPVTFLAISWYALIAWGNWYPLLVCYGGGIISITLYSIGSAIVSD